MHNKNRRSFKLFQRERRDPSDQQEVHQLRQLPQQQCQRNQAWHPPATASSGKSSSTFIILVAKGCRCKVAPGKDLSKPRAIASRIRTWIEYQPQRRRSLEDVLSRWTRYNPIAETHHSKQPAQASTCILKAADHGHH